MALIVFTVVAGIVSAATAWAEVVPTSEPLVRLSRDEIARAAPHAHADPLETITARRPLTHVRTVLPVRGHSTSSRGASWLRVALPGRPNGRVGWVPAAATRPTSTPWRISVRLGGRVVTVFRAGNVVRRFRAIVGAPSTPTPRGRFFIEEALSLAPGAPGAPFALATSARSTVLQEFGGGPGQIALHGTGNLPGALGAALSHGCIRLSTGAITWLARHIGPGVPLTIVL